MLAKSKKSAVLMGMIFLIPAVTIAVVAGQVRYLLLQPSEQNPHVVDGFAGTGPILMAVAIALVSLGIAALVIDRLDESHFGRQGANRWAIAGMIYGLLQQVILTPIPSDFDFETVSILKQIGGDLLWKGLALVITYLLVFPCFTLVRDRIALSKPGR